jgi:hypothetical protein
LREIEAYLLSLKAIPNERVQETRWLREYYCAWIKNNGVLVSEIRPDHESFFEWLGCE